MAIFRLIFIFKESACLRLLAHQIWSLCLLPVKTQVGGRAFPPTKIGLSNSPTTIGLKVIRHTFCNQYSKLQVFLFQTAITTDTLFRHSLLPNHRHIFEAKSFKGYFLGFNKQRLPKKGNRARIWKNDRCYFQVFNPSAFSTIKFKSVLYKHFKDSMRG